MICHGRYETVTWRLGETIAWYLRNVESHDCLTHTTLAVTIPFYVFFYINANVLSDFFLVYDAN